VLLDACATTTPITLNHSNIDVIPPAVLKWGLNKRATRRDQGIQQIATQRHKTPSSKHAPIVTRKRTRDDERQSHHETNPAQFRAFVWPPQQAVSPLPAFAKSCQVSIAKILAGRTVSCRRRLRRQAFCNHTNRETTRAASFVCLSGICFRNNFSLWCCSQHQMRRNSLPYKSLAQSTDSWNLARNLLPLQHEKGIRPISNINHGTTGSVSTNTTPQKGVVYSRMQCVRGQLGHPHSTLTTSNNFKQTKKLVAGKASLSLQTQDERLFLLFQNNSTRLKIGYRDSST
jgi:hypothetical protein